MDTTYRCRRVATQPRIRDRAGPRQSEPGKFYCGLGTQMFVIVDDREIVKTGYASSFGREGVASTGLRPDEFEEWVSGVGKPDLLAVEAFLIGDCSKREVFPRMIRERCHVPVIALNDSQSLEQTLELFAAGVDDV